MVALALTPGERSLLRRLLRAHLEREPADETARSVAQMLRAPVRAGELAAAFGPGEAYEPGHVYAAPVPHANGAGRC